jgi:endonuclease YncB( thermonuclease family)
MAWFYRRYRDDLPSEARERYPAAENDARRAGSGLWQAPEPQPPWEYRRGGRDSRSAEISAPPRP